MQGKQSRSARNVKALWFSLLATVACQSRVASSASCSKETVDGGHRRVSLSETSADRLNDDIPRPRTDELDPWLRPPSADQPQPKFVCEATEIDLGRLWAKGWQTVKGWRFRNDGDAPLHIDMRHTCCTSAIGTNRISIPPGQSRQIELRVLVDRPVSSRIFTAAAKTNDPSNQRINLRATCAVLHAIHVEPDFVEFDGIAQTEDEVTKTVTITRADGSPIRPSVAAVELGGSTKSEDGKWKRTWVPMDGDRVEASIREIKPGEHYELKLIVRRPWPDNEPLVARMRLDTSVEELPEKTITVLVRTQGAD